MIGVVVGSALIVSAEGKAAPSRSAGRWYVASGTSLARAAGPTSAPAYRVTNRRAVRGIVVLNDKTSTFRSTTERATYKVTAWIRTADTVGTRIGLREKEYRAGTYLGRAQSTLRLRDTKWHKITVRYVARSGHSKIDVSLIDWKLPARHSFQVGGFVFSGPGEHPRVVNQPARGPSSPSGPAAAAGAVPGGYHLVWDDEFNGRSVDSDSWNVLDNSTYGDGGNELACLENRPQNISESRGALHLTARREAPPIRCDNGRDRRFPAGRRYTSAQLTTQGKKSFRYGYLEIRAKLPTQANTSQGMWPAFWLRPANGSIGEIDVLEAIGSGPGSSSQADKVYQTIWYDYNGTYPKEATAYAFPSGTPSDGYHTYAIRWTPRELDWLVDGNVTFTRNRSTTSWFTKAFDQPFYLRLNLAVGGDWPGSPTSATALPASYDIDYVRVYQQ